MAKQQQNAAGAKDVLSLDEDLDSLFAEALAASEERGKKKKKSKSTPTAMDEDGYFDLDDADQSIHIMVDDDSNVPTLASEDEDSDEPNHGPEFSLDDLDFLKSLETPSDKPAKKKSRVKNTIDDLDAEFRAALAEDDGSDDDDDLQAEMEKLLAQSFAGTVSDDDPDLGFPEIDDEDDDEEILAMGDDSSAAPTSRDDTERYRNQIAELSRLLSTRDLELRTVEDRVETLESQMVAAARQSANIGREFESFRKRSERERGDLEKFAGEKVIKEFLGVFDNLERALEHAGEQRDSPLGKGVDMILGQFRGALKRCGVEPVDSAAGVEFDPTFHEAVGQEHHATIPAGGILSEMQAGFVLNGRLVRAAMVTVSQGPKEAPPPKPAKKAATKKKATTKAKAKAPADKKKTTKKKTPPQGLDDRRVIRSS